MRDLLIIFLVGVGSLAALRRPWIGILVWTWLSIMNPHRYTYGFAYDAPLAAAAALATLIGTLATRDKGSPFISTSVTWLGMLMLWMTLSWLLGLDVSDDYVQWNKVMKIDFMVLVALALIRSKQQIIVLMWVVVASLAILGAKGGVFTVMTGGSYRVWGPPGSFIEDNNEFALSLVMTVPLLRFLQLQVHGRWAKRGLLLAMLLCAAAALGSQSRGALIAIVAMALLLWWRGQNKLLPGIFMLVFGTALVAFMPDQWTHRMNTIESYEQDGSAMGRINAWWNAWNLAFHYVTGVGFNAARPELFARFAPNPTDIHAAHSIYFQILGNHGFVGLILFIGMFVATWRDAAWLMRSATVAPETKWCADLGAMAQVSLMAYAVGGAFLSLAYFDLPYEILLMTAATRTWVIKRGWETEPQKVPRWLIGLGVGVARSPPLATTKAAG